jgi:hypothetical protein
MRSTISVHLLKELQSNDEVTYKCRKKKREERLQMGDISGTRNNWALKSKSEHGILNRWLGYLYFFP